MKHVLVDFESDTWIARGVQGLRITDVYVAGPELADYERCLDDVKALVDAKCGANTTIMFIYTNDAWDRLRDIE